jgi:hypothetical protein
MYENVRIAAYTYNSAKSLSVNKIALVVLELCIIRKFQDIVL